jgi:hypothetical protein
MNTTASKKAINANLQKTETQEFVYFYSPDVDLWFEWNRSQTVNVQSSMAGQDLDCFSGSYGPEAKGTSYFRKLIVDHIQEML